MLPVIKTIVAAACAVLLPLHWALAQTVWTMPTEYPASAMPGEGVAFFAAEVEKRLAGKLSIKPSFNAEMGIKSAEMPAAVTSGRIQAGDAFGGAMGSVSPAFGLSSLPFTVGSVDEARRLSEASRAFHDKAFAGLGLKLLYVTPWPPSGIWSKAPVASAADLKGLPIRTYDGTSTQVLTAAGAATQNLSFADVMPKLADGSVTAVLSSGDGGAGRRLWTHLPNFTQVNYAFPLSFAFVGRAAYDALPPDQRQAVDEAARATELRQWSTIAGRMEQNYAVMRQNGVAIRDTAPADVTQALRAAAAPVVEAWARNAGDEGRAALASVRR